jgi:F-type H+-transporting ATPase subunit b
MAELIHQLGIDWRLLLSQAVNFAVLLFVLRAFAYKPILKILKDRQMKIEEGFTKAKEADLRLHQANEMAKGKMKDADEQALAMLRETEDKAKTLEAELLAAAKAKEAAIMANADAILAGKAEEARRAIHKEAASLVKAALVRTVEMDPKAVDEALIGKAVAEAAGRK